MNLKLRSCGTQMTLHYSESYRSVSAYYMLHTVVCVLPHIIFITSLGSAIIPILQMTKQRHRIKWSDQVHTAASLTPEALAITYPNTVLDFMIDSSMKGKRLDWCQVLGTYSHGSNNNYELKNNFKKSRLWSPEHPSTLYSKGKSYSRCSFRHITFLSITSLSSNTAFMGFTCPYLYKIWQASYWVWKRARERERET